MALRDTFRKAPLLDSLGWMGLQHHVRVARLANLYLESESKIRSEVRNYECPTKGIVKTFITSFFKPPRGLGTKTVEDTIREIKRQRIIRNDRAENPPWKFHQGSVSYRRRKLSKTMYRIVSRDYRGKLQYSTNTPIEWGRIAGCVIIGDSDYSRCARLYMRHIETNKVKVVVLDHKGKMADIDTMLRFIAPKAILRGTFEGRSITLDMLNEGFLADGVFHPWHQVRKVYRGPVRAMKTYANPKKPD